MNKLMPQMWIMAAPNDFPAPCYNQLAGCWPMKAIYKL